MAEYLVQGESITAVADAIREKGGTTAPLSFPAGMAKAVRGIPSGGTDISLGLTAATVGQTVKVKAVDADGKPTAWEAVDAAGGDLSWIEVADITTEEQTQKLIISTNKDGRPISQYNALEMIFSIYVPADATQTSDSGALWIYPYPKIGKAVDRYIANIATWKTIARGRSYAWAGLPGVQWTSATSDLALSLIHI